MLGDLLEMFPDLCDKILVRAKNKVSERYKNFNDLINELGDSLLLEGSLLNVEKVELYKNFNDEVFIYYEMIIKDRLFMFGVDLLNLKLSGWKIKKEKIKFRLYRYSFGKGIHWRLILRRR